MPTNISMFTRELENHSGFFHQNATQRLVQSLSNRRSEPKPRSTRTMATPRARIRGLDRRSPSFELVVRGLDKRLNSTRRNAGVIRKSAKARRARFRQRLFLQLQQRSSGPMSHSMEVTVPQDTGSHTFDGGTFIQCEMVTIGNTLDDGGDDQTPNSLSAPVLPSHEFKGLRVFDSRGVHFGNTGSGSQGHKFTDIEAWRNGGVHSGDFKNARTKGAYFQSY
ncbi:hypothetical protein F5B21DRAFT_491179 [Xylaria acuta]|nr:hypothetical protein F5B21DRAFT_491179 [Xylaria acuta]